MAEALMANPELRHPFPVTPIHPEGSTTLLYQGRKMSLEHTGSGTGLLVRPQDLPGINGFEVKPEGICYNDLCIPATPELLVEQDGSSWLNLTALADVLEQPWVADEETRVWSFGEIPAKRQNTMQGAMAPDFSVTDRTGNVVTLADLKGKKALIVTWSSW